MLEPLFKTTARSLVLLLVACGTRAPERDDKKPSPPPSPPRVVEIPERDTLRQVELPEPEIALPRQLAFEVIELGQGKRQPLQYAFTSGPARLVTRTQLTSRELRDGTWHDPTKQPSQPSELVATIDGSGGISVRAASADAELALTLDARGQLAGFPTRDASAEDVAQRLLATIVPVPDQEIGVGARWRVVTALRQQGVVLRQTATYTLVSRGKARWKIDVDIQRLAEPQRLGDIELVAIVRRLRGTFEIDPSVPFPQTGTLAVESTVHARSRGGAENIVEDTGTIELLSGR